jgi:pimeloyl-ACP methyl ester carboxylesterase
MRRRSFIAAAATGIVVPSIAEPVFAGTTEGAAASGAPVTGHVDINGLQMYYESHGSGGVPLVLLHGAFSSIHNTFGGLIPALAARRQVVGFDLQGHGRTADIDRPMTHDGLVSDIIAGLDALGLEQVDLFGYSNGAYLALLVAIRHPQRVRKLVVLSVSTRLDGIHPGLMEGFGDMQPSMMYGSPWHTEYMELNPKPDFDRLFRKKSEMDKNIKDIQDVDLQALKQPVLIMAGDSDLPTVEHLAQVFRLVGGGVFGDTPAGLPNSQLAILPGTSHVSAPYQTELLKLIVPAFLDKQEKPAA